MKSDNHQQQIGGNVVKIICPCRHDGFSVVEIEMEDGNRAIVSGKIGDISKAIFALVQFEHKMISS